MKSLSRFILRRAGVVALLGTILGAIGLYYSALLYKNLKTDIEELLPNTARSVIDLDQVTRRLNSIHNLSVLVLSKDIQASKRFVDDLATELKKAPPEIIAGVEYRIDKELKFFKDRSALYLELSDLNKVRNYIDDRIEYEKQLYNPLNIFSSTEIPEPKLDFKAMRSKYEGKVSGYSGFPDGYYATKDQTKRVVLVYLPALANGIEGNKRLAQYVQDTINRLNPKSYAPDLDTHFCGDVQNMIDEQSALIADLELSTVICTVLISLSIIVFFRSFRLTVALLIGLFIGTFWTFGASYFAVGYLNANSAFLGSIVLGNGINFFIIMLARYTEERRKDHDHAQAIEIAMSHTATATWTAALAAGLSYGSLVLTGFRGFKQFGIIGLMGMLLCWISAFTLLPAFLTLFERRRTLIKKGSVPPRAYLTEAVGRFISKYPMLIWSGTIAVSLVAAAMFHRFTPEIIETNLGNLGSKKSLTEGSGYWAQYVDEIFGRYLTPMAVLPDSRESALRIAEALKKQKQKEGKDSLIVSVQTMDDFIPKDQPEKIRLLRDIRYILPERLLAQISPADQRLVREFLNDTAMKEVKLDELPGLVLSKFTEKDGTIGKLVAVEPPLSNATWQGEKLVQFVRTLRNIADAEAPGTPVAGTLPISADMLESIMREGPKATLLAFIAVVMLVIVLFRSFKTIALTLFALLLGVLWLAGIMLAFGLKINFLNFIALPITFGIGVDYGVNIFQRYKQEGSSSIMNVIRDTGGAVGLCSLTTVIGYSSLLIAENQAFVSFGTISVLGEITCLTAAIFSLPAFLLVRARKKKAKAPQLSGTTEQPAV